MPLSCWYVFDVCVEKRLDLANAVLVGVGLLGLLSIYFSFRQLRAGQRAQQTQTLLQLHDDFFRSDELRAFLYRLDYKDGPNAWRFDEATFRHSHEEKCLDLILYKLAFIGTLIQNKDIRPQDLLWLRAETAMVLENEDVHAYLRWLQTPNQLPGHASFSGAVHLYTGLFGNDTDANKPLKRYLAQARPT